MTSEGHRAAGIAANISGQVAGGNCYSTGTITGGGWYSGGISAYVDSSYASVKNCYAAGSVTGSGAGAVFGHHILAGHVQRDGCEFISFFVVLIEFENDLGSGRALRKAVQLRHFGIHEFDEPFVGVEFHGLNLYVHSLTVYKS